MRPRLIGFTVAAVVGLAVAIEFYAVRLRTNLTPPVPSSHLDRIIVLVLESYRSDAVDPAKIASNPFLTKLAAQNRVAVNYYGVWKPSLPNYLAMIGGETFGVSNNQGSCFNPDHARGCHSIDAAFLSETIPAIVNAPAFTDRSVLFITFDNSTGIGGCCGHWIGGGRIPLIAVTKLAMKVRATTPSNHYSLLATIEDGFGLPRLANARGAATLFDLFPDFAERPDAQTSVGNGLASGCYGPVRRKPTYQEKSFVVSAFWRPYH